jgi:4-amino-4-deoxy-L-arabinose transferase-like glycosyltransferase
MHFGLGIPLLIALTLPWFWLVQQRNPEFAQFFFVHEHFARFLTDVSERQEAWWYFLMIAAVAVLPVAANFAGVWRAGVGQQRPPQQFQVEKFLLIWCVVVVAFFSVSHSKLAPYIMPIMPPLAVLLARGLATDPRAHRRTAAVAFGFFTVLASAIIAYSLRRHGSIGTGSALWALTGVVASLAAFLFARRRTHERASAAWLAIAAAAIVAIQGLIMAYAFLPPMRSAKMLAADLAPLGERGTIYSVGQFRHTLVFYLEHPMEVFAYTGELEFGLTQAGVGPREITDFQRRWAAEHDALAFMEPTLYAQLQAAGMPGHVIARDARSVAVSRQ